MLIEANLEIAARNLKEDNDFSLRFVIMAYTGHSMKNPATDGMFSNSPAPVSEDPDRLTRSHTITRRRFIQYGAATTSSLMAMAAAGLEKGGGEQQLLSNTSWLLLEQSPASGSDQFQNTGTNTWPTSLSGLWYDNTYVLEAEFNYSPVADSNSTKARSKNTQITSRVGIAVYQRRQGVIPVPNWTHAGNVFLNYNTGRAWGNYEMTTPDNSVKAATCSDMGKAGDHNGYQGWKLTFTCEDDPNGGGTFTDYKMYHLNVKAEKVGDSSQVLEVDSSDLLVTIVPAEGS